MSEYRVAHVALTCMAVFVVIESAMIGLFREYGLMSVTSGRFTPVPVDAVSHQVWLWMGSGVLVLREPVLRLLFRRRVQAETETLEAFVALYRVGGRLVGVLLCLVFVPHLALLCVIEDLPVGFAASFEFDPVLVGADAAVVFFVALLWCRPGWFVGVAMIGSRRS